MAASFVWPPPAQSVITENKLRKLIADSVQEARDGKRPTQTTPDGVHSRSYILITNDELQKATGLLDVHHTLREKLNEEITPNGFRINTAFTTRLYEVKFPAAPLGLHVSWPAV